MTMNRRSALKNLTIVSGGLISLPAGMVSCGISDSDTHHSSFNKKEQETLAAVADTIIPAGTAIGALSVGVDKFLQKLLDDCYEQPVQESVKNQLHSLDNLAQNTHNKNFNNCTQEQRQAMLLKLEGSANKDEKDFFELMKKETIRGFSTSQQVMEDYHGYTIAPGHYYGCVPVQS